MTANTHTLLNILYQSKESQTITDATQEMRSVLDDLEIPENGPGVYHVPRDKRIEIALVLARQRVELEEIVKVLTWKDFESFVATILMENGFRCVESLRRRGNATVHGMEIDVVGVQGRRIISVDAKMWDIRGGKTAALKRAAEEQRRRTRELASDLSLLQKKISLAPGTYTLYPVIVTWLIEEVTFHDGVPVVPVFQLNSFIIDLPIHEDVVVSFSGTVS
ncbi:MAG: hypothetical protein K9W43_03160 [Candidatus Thorarchaeota archaeon]|nr:hypothetical protein [Candidatus Thorarchaeota archaeon]